MLLMHQALPSKGQHLEKPSFLMAFLFPFRNKALEGSSNSTIQTHTNQHTLSAYDHSWLLPEIQAGVWKQEEVCLQGYACKH